MAAGKPEWFFGFLLCCAIVHNAFAITLLAHLLVLVLKPKPAVKKKPHHRHGFLMPPPPPPPQPTSSQPKGPAVRWWRMAKKKIRKSSSSSSEDEGGKDDNKDIEQGLPPPAHEPMGWQLPHQHVHGENKYPHMPTTSIDPVHRLSSSSSSSSLSSAFSSDEEKGAKRKHRKPKTMFGRVGTVIVNETDNICNKAKVGFNKMTTSD